MNKKMFINKVNKQLTINLLFLMSLGFGAVTGLCQETTPTWKIGKSSLITTLSNLNKKDKKFVNLMSDSLSLAQASIPEIFDIKKFDGKLSKAELTYFSANTNLEVFGVNASIYLVSNCGQSQPKVKFTIGSGTRPTSVVNGHQPGDLRFVMDKMSSGTYVASVNFGHANLQIEDNAKKSKYFLDNLSAKLFYYVATNGKIYPAAEKGFPVDSVVDYQWTGSAFENLKQQFELLMKNDKNKTFRPLNKGHMLPKDFNDVYDPEITVSFPLTAAKMKENAESKKTISDVDAIQEIVNSFESAHAGATLGLCDLLEGIQLN